MEASYRVLKTFETLPRYTWRRGSAFLVVLTNNPTPTLPPKLGIPLCRLAIYKPTPLPRLLSASSIWYLTLPFSVFLRSVCRLLVTVTIVPSSPILVTLMMEAVSPLKRRFLQEPHGVTSQKTEPLHNSRWLFNYHITTVYDAAVPEFNKWLLNF
jgi:hypothetical protein